MEIVKPEKYGPRACAKLAEELKTFSGNSYCNAVKACVAATLTNFCGQSERFAQVVLETPATLSDCCAKIMEKCGQHISDIDVYRAAVRFYFPNAEVVFTMTIDDSGEAPTADQLAKPVKRPEPERNSPAVEEEDEDEPEEEAAPEKPKAAMKPAAAPAEEKKPAKQKKEQKQKPDDMIQLTLF